MAENKDLNLTAAQHELDENENPSTLNFNSSICTVSDSFNLINSESGKMCYQSESQNVSDDALISTGLSTPKKNALIDSGFHCENLEKTVLPDLINNSLCESVDNELANSIRETKQVSTTSGVSFCSNNDNSFNASMDTSFNVLANTTTNNIALLFERLTLNSDGNASTCHDLENSLTLESSALPEKIFNDNHIPSATMPTKVPFNENNKHPNLSDLAVDFGGSNLESLDISVSSDPVPESNKVPLDETFTAPNPVVPINAESFDCSTSKTSNSECPFSSEASLDNIFKHPLPVPESNNLSNIQNISGNTMFEMNPDDNFDGEEFQDAVQFFKDPSSFQVLENIKSSDASSARMPRDSLYMTFDPLYKRVIQPTSIISPGVEENDNGCSIKEEIGDGNNQCVNDHVSNTIVQGSLGGNLVSFDSPLKSNSAESLVKDNEDLKKVSVNEDNCSVNSDEQSVHKNVIVRKSLSGNLVSFDSPIKSNSVENFVKEGEDLKKIVVQEEICCVDSAVSNEQHVDKNASIVIVRDSLGGNLVTFDSPMKNNSAGNSEIKCDDGKKKSVTEEISSNEPIDSPMKSNYTENSETECENLKKESVKDEICNVIHAENNQQFVSEHISDVPARESLSGNLLSFDSPMRSISARNSVNMKALLKTDQKVYTEEEFQQTLKIYELTMQETYLKKQKELEEEFSKNRKEIEEAALKKQKEMEEDALKKGGDTTKKLKQVTELCKILLDTVSELATVTSEQSTKIGDLSARIINLETEKQKLDSDLKTSTEDLQSVEHTFSDFHKRYVQCKDMLKTYKDNEDALKCQVESLNKKLEEQEQMYGMLQTKMGETVDKANAEVAAAKKGGDAQIAVLRAQLKKSELKVSSLESDLKQVRIENDKLSNICDDLMAKVSEA